MFWVGSGPIWGLCAGQNMIRHFGMIFWLDGGSFNQPGVRRRVRVLKLAPWLGGAARGDCMFTQEEIQNLTGATAYDQAGKKVGQVATVYQDQATGEPEWLTVKTGLFGMKETFVPLALAQVRGAGEVGLAADKDTITSAPKIDPDGELSRAEEEQLYSYYGQRYGEPGSPGGLAGTSGQAMTDAYGAPGAQGYDTSGPTTDEAMTRSEERMHVGTATQEAGRARLRKYVVTETVQQSVPVSHEEVR